MLECHTCDGREASEEQNVEEEEGQEEGEEEDLLWCSSGQEASPVLVFPPL